MMSKLLQIKEQKYARVVVSVQRTRIPSSSTVLGMWRSDWKEKKGKALGGLNNMYVPKTSKESC